MSDAQVHAPLWRRDCGQNRTDDDLARERPATRWRTRRATPLYRLKTASARVAEVVPALAEGRDVSAAVRVFGQRHATIPTWLTRAGEPSATQSDRVFRDLQLPHIQFDEIRTRLRSRTHTVWLWLAVDPISKIIPALHLGARTQHAAHAVVHDLRQRLAPGCLPVFSSDGLNHSFYALTAHFGQWLNGIGRRARQWLLRGGADRRAGQKRLAVPAASASHACDALRDMRSSEGSADEAGPEWAAEECVCGAS